MFVEEAERWIEDHLADRIRVSALAKQLNISQSQLTRLFLTEHGNTP